MKQFRGFVLFLLGMYSLVYSYSVGASSDSSQMDVLDTVSEPRYFHQDDKCIRMKYLATKYTYCYNDFFRYQDSIEKWTKEYKTGKISAKMPATTWLYIPEEGKSIYKWINTSLIRDNTKIIYQDPVSKYSYENGVIHYTFPAGSLIIDKDKITYKAPGETRIIDGNNWVYKTPTETYNN